MRVRFVTNKVTYEERIKEIYKNMQRLKWLEEGEKNPFKRRLREFDEAPTPRSQKSTISKTSLAKTDLFNLFNNGNLLLKLREERGKVDISETKSIQCSEQSKLWMQVPEDTNKFFREDSFSVIESEVAPGKQ